jgi:hypothetical protein
MKKALSLSLSLYIVVTSLLIGIVITVGMSRVSEIKDSSLTRYCGLQVNRQTGVVAKFNTCAVDTYGYPVKYVTSGVSSTIITSQSEYSSYSVGYTSISRLRFVADWALWSVAACVVAVGVGSFTMPHGKKASKKKK